MINPDLRVHRNDYVAWTGDRKGPLSVEGLSIIDWHGAYPLRGVVLGMHEAAMLAGSDA